MSSPSFIEFGQPPFPSLTRFLSQGLLKEQFAIYFSICYSLTDAICSIPSKSSFAGALIRTKSILAIGIDIAGAVYGAAFIHICQSWKTIISQEIMGIQVLRQNWRWILHTLRTLRVYIARKTLFGNPQVRKRQGQRKQNEGLRATAKDYSTINQLAQKRNKWRKSLVVACRSQRQPIYLYT